MVYIPRHAQSNKENMKAPVYSLVTCCSQVMLIVIEVQRTAWSSVQYSVSLEGCTLEDMRWGEKGHVQVSLSNAQY